MRKTKAQKGITLVALIITIVVLLILALVTINAVRGDGIIRKAQQAKEEYQTKSDEEKSTLGGYLAFLKGNAPGGSSSEEGGSDGESEDGTDDGSSDDTEDDSSDETGSDNVESNENFEDIIEPEDTYAVIVDEAGNNAQKRVLSTTSNTNVYDEYGNKIVVPPGFMVTAIKGRVTEGVVIEDATGTGTNGSQFVWIPVGNVYTNKSKTDYKTIELKRYVFNDEGEIDNTLSTTRPTDYIVIESYSGTNYYLEGLKNSTEGNATAKDIQGFITSAKTNGGYYLGRFEARDGVTTSIRGTSTSDTNTVVCKKNRYIYNYVTPKQASSLAKNMYINNNFTSDLVNSFAWDTAIVFIQTFSGDTDYSKQTTLTSGFAPKGTENDVRCNIYDMASNCYDLSTEYCTSWYNATVGRGGNYYWGNPGTSMRTHFVQDAGMEYLTFRPILYIL